MSQNPAIKEYKCPACGAPLVYDGTSEKMKCGSCGNTFTLEQLQAFSATVGRDTSDQNNWSDYHTGKELTDMKMYVCPSCGGEIVGDDTVAATECPYCGNPTIIEKQLSGMYAPEGIIPFKKDKQAAEEALQSFYRGKFLLPRAFASGNRIEKVRGIYVPFWLFDCEADADISYDATRTRMWTRGDTDYIQTDHYLIIRQGRIGYAKIPVDGSKKMDDSYMDSIEPFDYAGLKEFNDAYLSGYLANKYDVTSDECLPRVNERVRNSTAQAFAATVRGYESVLPRSVNINIQSGQIRYVMMPVWLLNTRWNGKLYTFMMNGQTGQMVGSLPMDKAKAVWTWLAIFGLITALALVLVFTQMGGVL